MTPNASDLRQNIVDRLRLLRTDLTKLGKMSDDDFLTYFPAPSCGENGSTQPIQLANYVANEDLGGLLGYIADMLEE